MLKTAAERLVSAVREEDTVARLGGDEFAIALWPIINTGDAVRLGSKLIEAMSQPYSIQGQLVSASASVGIGLYPDHGEDVETLMKSADLALYDAKGAGKNVYRISERSVLAGNIEAS